MINNKKVLVIGDVILDVWTYAKAVGLSLETPTLKSKLIEKKHTFGGSANVVSNLKELGADITFLTLLGDDEYTKTYESIKDIKLYSVVEDDRKNTIKERFWIERGGSNYKHLQVNVIDNKSIKKESIDKMIKNIEDILDDKFDVVMLIDYRHGLFTKDFLNRLMPVLNKKSIPIVVSSQISDYGRGLVSNHINFKGADLIVMNKLEAEFNLGKNQSIEDLPQIFGCDICVTSGRGGSTLFMGGEKYHSEVIDIEEVDPCGAGDSFISALCLTNWKESPEDSLFISNCWAGLSVENHGTICPKKKQLKYYLENI